MRLKDVKKGQRFVEEDRGMYVRVEALEDAHEVVGDGRNGYECRARVIGGYGRLGAVVTYFESHNTGAYGLRLTADSDV